MRVRVTTHGIGYVALLPLTLWLNAACVRQPAPVTPETSPPPPASTSTTPPPAATPPPPAPPPVVPTELSPDDEFASRSLEEINRESPLEPAYFLLDSAELDERARRVLEANAELLQRYPTWVVTIEGHCDERGTPEYNLEIGRASCRERV